MAYAIKASTNNPSTMFLLNELEYPKDVFTIEYGSYQDNSGTPENVTVAIVNKYNGKQLVPPATYDNYSDGSSSFGSLNALMQHLSSTVGFNLAGASALTTTNGLVFVDSVADLPAAVSGVITLIADTAYFFLQNIDLAGSRIVCPSAPVAILGTTSETASITSTGLDSDTAMITATRTLVIQNITMLGVGTLFDIDGTGGTNVALDWRAFNIINVPTIGTIQNIDNAIWSTCAILSSAGLTYTGDFNTVSFAESIATATSTGTIFTLDADAVCGRRFRIIYSSIVAGAPSSTGINVNASASIPLESYILDTVSFAGAGTYITGLDATDNKTLFVNNVGILNSKEISNYYMIDNASSTTITSSSTPVKAAGTTTSNSTTQKFTNTSNRATYTGALTRTFTALVTCSVIANNNNQIGIYIAKNGSVIDSSEVYSTVDGSGRRENIVTQAIVELTTDDYLEVWVENRSSTANITVSELNFIVN